MENMKPHYSLEHCTYRFPRAFNSRPIDLPEAFMSTRRRVNFFFVILFGELVSHGRGRALSG